MGGAIERVDGESMLGNLIKVNQITTVRSS